MASFVIGKPSHATGVHPGTRMESRFGSIVYHCPQPCGESFSDLGKLRAHVKRTLPTRYWPRVCPLTLAAKAARLAVRIAALTDEQLVAALAQYSRPKP